MKSNNLKKPTKRQVRPTVKYLLDDVHLGFCVCDECNPDRHHDDPDRRERMR